MLNIFFQIIFEHFLKKSLQSSGPFRQMKSEFCQVGRVPEVRKVDTLFDHLSV